MKILRTLQLQILRNFDLRKESNVLSFEIPRFIASIITALLYNVCTNEYPISRNLFAVKVACVYRPLSRNVRDIRVGGAELYPLDDQTNNSNRCSLMTIKRRDDKSC